jgi:hypothetical protein
MMNITVDEKTDSGLFAHNDLFDIVEGVKYTGRKWILFKNLEANAVNNADHRDGGLIPALVARLVESFSRGVRFSACIPVVEMHPTPKKYIDENGNVEYYYAKLVDGHNRIEALKEKGCLGYWFDVAVFGDENISYDKARTNFAMSSNVDLPKVPSTNKDIFKAARNLVEKKELECDIPTIANWIVNVCRIGQATATAIANEVAAAEGSQDAIVLYSPNDIKKGLGRFGIASQGNYDLSRGEHGWTCKTGYEHETALNILKKLAETGNTSYVTIHTKMPHGQVDIDDLRHGSVEGFEEVFGIFDAYANWKKKNPSLKAYRIEGALPQKVSELNKKKVIKL